MNTPRMPATPRSSFRPRLRPCGKYQIHFFLVSLLSFSGFLPTECFSYQDTFEEGKKVSRRLGPCVKQLGQDLNKADTNNKAQSKAIALSSDGKTVAVGVAVPKVTLANGIEDVLPGFVQVFSYQESTNTWELKGKTLTRPNNENIGSSIDLSGDGTKLVVGSPSSNDLQGLIALYSYNALSKDWDLSSEWTGASQFKDKFGTSVAVSSDGTTFAGGGPGYSNKVGLSRIDTNVGFVGAFVFNPVTSQWAQKPSGELILGGYEFAAAGSSVDLSGDGGIIAVGLPGNVGGVKDQGSVKVYEFNNASKKWVQRGQTLGGGGAGDEFGTALALSEDGNTVAIGAEKNKVSDFLGTKYRNAGYVRVHRYRKETSNWILLGSRIDGTQYNARFGSSVALFENGDGLVVGGVGYGREPDGGSVGYGLVSVFKYTFDSNTWIKQEGHDIWGQNERDGLGSDVGVSSDGSVIAVTGVFGKDETKVFSVASFGAGACQAMPPPPGVFVNEETSTGMYCCVSNVSPLVLFAWVISFFSW